MRSRWAASSARLRRVRSWPIPMRPTIWPRSSRKGSLEVRSQHCSPLGVVEKLLPVEDGLPAFDDRLVVGPEARGHLGREEVKIGLAQNLGLGLAAHVFEVGGVGEGFAALHVLDEDGVGEVVDEGAQEDALALEGLLGLAPGGDVFHDAVEANPAFLVEPAGGADGRPEPAAFERLKLQDLVGHGAQPGDLLDKLLAPGRIRVEFADGVGHELFAGPGLEHGQEGGVGFEEAAALVGGVAVDADGQVVDEVLVLEFGLGDAGPEPGAAR